MTNPQCPVCDGETSKVDIPDRNIYTCKTCKELVQVVADGSLIPIGEVLDRNAMGDDRVRAVISTPRARTVASFLDVLQGSVRYRRYEEDANLGALRTMLAQVENRIDSAISGLTGFALVHEEVADAIAGLTEARELVSTSTPQQRGVREPGEDEDDGIDDLPSWRKDGPDEQPAEDGSPE